MTNEERLIEVMAELLAEVHGMREDIGGMRKDIAELNTEQAKTNLSIQELRLSVMKLADFSDRIIRLEREVFKKAS